MNSVRTSSLIFSLLLVLFTLTGCDRDDGVVDPGGDESMLAEIQRSIFDGSCAVTGCHIGQSAFGSLDLSSADRAFENLVGVPATLNPELSRVEPGDPDNSFLIIKLEGGARLVGSQMPLDRPPLGAAQIQLVRDWIAAGAERE